MGEAAEFLGVDARQVYERSTPATCRPPMSRVKASEFVRRDVEDYAEAD